MTFVDYNFFLADDFVGLQELDISCIDGNYKFWLNDEEICKGNTHHRFPQGPNDLKDFILKVKESTNTIVFAVYLINENRHVGNISLQSISYIDSSAEIAFLLGEKDVQGKGVMFRSAVLLINHAFNALNLRRIFCGTLDTNLAMKKLAQKLGMSKEGCRIQAVYKEGKYVDVIEFGLLKQNWRF